MVIRHLMSLVKVSTRDKLVLLTFKWTVPIKEYTLWCCSTENQWPCIDLGTIVLSHYLAFTSWQSPSMWKYCISSPNPHPNNDKMQFKIRKFWLCWHSCLRSPGRGSIKFWPSWRLVRVDRFLWKLTGSVISSPVSVAGSEAVGRVAEVSGGSDTFGAVCTGAGHFKHGPILLASVQRVMGGSISTIPIHFGVRVITGSWTAVIPEFSVTNTERIGGSFLVNTTGIMGFLSNKAWKSITRAGATVHSSDRATGFCIIVHHGY